MASSRSTEIEGMKVFAQAGREVGIVTGLDVDLTGFRILTVEIKLKREILESLNMKVPLMGTQSIHLEVAHVSAIGDTMVLGMTLEQLAGVSTSEAE